MTLPARGESRARSVPGSRRRPAAGARLARLPLLVVVALLAGGCALAPPPEVVVTTDVGVVRAADRGVALETAEDLPQLVDALRAELVGTRDDSVEVWVQDDVSLHRGDSVSASIGGFTHRGLDRIHVGGRRRAERMLYLAHELVHLLLDEVWATLPLAVEEGLCDHLALAVTGYDGVQLVARHVAGGALAFDELGFTVHLVPTAAARARTAAAWGRIAMRDAPQPFETWLSRTEDAAAADFDTDASVRMRGIGYVLARRILERGGIDALRALCVRATDEGRARVPTTWLLDAAGLPTGEALAIAWRRWTSHLAGSREVAVLVAAHAEVLVDPIADLLEAKGIAPERVFDDLSLLVAVADGRPRHRIEPRSPLADAIVSTLAAR